MRRCASPISASSNRKSPEAINVWSVIQRQCPSGAKGAIECADEKTFDAFVLSIAKTLILSMAAID
jgi:hypothetical protein